MDWIDLRSDTVTRPTAAMRRAIAEADVGDDVYGEDPTVNALQQRLAAELGFEAGLFVPSGTQANLLALMSHCGRGDEYLPTIRLATHIDIDDAGVEHTLAAFGGCFAAA